MFVAEPRNTTALPRAFDVLTHRCDSLQPHLALSGKGRLTKSVTRCEGRPYLRPGQAALISSHPEHPHPSTCRPHILISQPITLRLLQSFINVVAF